MNSAQKRNLRKEILILRAQAYRTEILREATQISETFTGGSVVKSDGGGWFANLTQSSLWTLLTSGNTRWARWLRWGSAVYKFFPSIVTLWARKSNES